MTPEPNLKGALCLVTGGAGFIGSHLVRRLLAEESRVRVLDDFSTGSRSRLLDVRDQIELLEASVTDVPACVAATQGVDTVFHLAALPSVQRSISDPNVTHEVAATGTLNLLLAARDIGVRRFVYAGSSSAYGDTEVLPKSEDLPTNPRSPYATAKLTGEHYTRVFSCVYGLDTVVLRYFNVFGPSQDPHSEYSAVVPLFILAALHNRSPTIRGDGEQTRDFTFVSNVVEANLQASLAPAEMVSGDVFNIGCGRKASINAVWNTIRELTGTTVEPEYGSPRAGDVRDSLASLRKSQERLGYCPEIDLEQGLRITVDWFRRQTSGPPSAG